MSIFRRFMAWVRRDKRFGPPLHLVTEKMLLAEIARIRGGDFAIAVVRGRHALIDGYWISVHCHDASLATAAGTLASAAELATGVATKAAGR